MPENQPVPDGLRLAALGRAAIGICGVFASAGGAIGGFANLRLLVRDLAAQVDGARVLLSPLSTYYFAWLVFFAALIATGISLMVAAVQGRREDIVPGPSLYLMGAALMIAGMAQLAFGRPLLAMLSAAAGLVLMYVEYRSALL